MSKIKKVPAWAVRKSAYFIGAAVVAILGAFGILSEVQVDDWTGQLDKIIPYVIGVVWPIFAGAKTNAGSDSTVTVADVHAGQADEEKIANSVVERLKQVNDYGEHALQKASESMNDFARYYNQQ